MNIITLNRTAEMTALQAVAKVKSNSFATTVEFGTKYIGNDKVTFKRDYRSKGLKVDQIEINGQWKHIFWASDMSELSEHQLMFVGAAMIALGLPSLAWDDILISLQEAVVERVVIVERPVYQQPRPRETVVIRQTQTRTYGHHDPEMDTAVAVGAAIGAGLGLLGSILRNR